MQAHHVAQECKERYIGRRWQGCTVQAPCLVLEKLAFEVSVFTIDACQRLRGTLRIGGAFWRHVDRHGSHELAAAAALAGGGGAAAVGAGDRLQGGPAASTRGCVKS